MDPEKILELALQNSKCGKDYKAVEEQVVDRMLRGLEQQIGVTAVQVAEIRTILLLTYDLAFQSGVESAIEISDGKKPE